MAERALALNQRDRESNERITALRQESRQSRLALGRAQADEDYNRDRLMRLEAREEQMRQAAEKYGERYEQDPFDRDVITGVQKALTEATAARIEAERNVVTFDKAEDDFRQEQNAIREGRLEIDRQMPPTVVGRGRDLPEDFSSSRMAAKREAMVTESDRRLGVLTQRETEARATFDQASKPFMDAVNKAETARRERYRIEDMIDSAERDRARGADPIAVDEAIARWKTDLADAKATTDRFDAQADAAQATYEKAREQARDQLLAVESERKGLATQIREKYVNAPEAARLSLYSGGRSMAALPKNWQDGTTVVGQIVGKGAVSDAFSPNAAEREIPNGRSYHNSTPSAPGTGGSITFVPNVPTSTVVHEIGHAVEDAIPGASERIWQHIDSRTQGEQAVSLRTATGRNFDPGETALLDKFADAYMGKTNYGRTASEFLSMSLQKYYEDPVQFAKADPQSFDFTLQMLAEARANNGTLPMP